MGLSSSLHFPSLASFIPISLVLEGPLTSLALGLLYIDGFSLGFSILSMLCCLSVRRVH